MAIKDQCNNCKSKNDCNFNKVYDGTNCVNYRKGINLEKQADIVSSQKDIDESICQESTHTYNVDDSIHKPDMEDNVVTQEYLKTTTTITGWLTFFLFSITIGGLFSFIYPCVTFDVSKYGGNEFFAISDVVFGILLCAFAFYTLYSFCQRKKDAVFLGKAYVVICFVSNLLALFVGEFESNGFNSITHVVRSLIWTVIWFIYLCESKQVREIFPKNYRQIMNYDYWIVGTLIIIPICCIIMGFHSIQKERQEDVVTFIEQAILQEGEYTDGRIIFKSPEGFVCERIEEDDIIVFSMENESVGNVTIWSDYDSDQSLSNINKYWKIWEDADAEQYLSSLVINEKRNVNGLPCYYKVKKYGIDGSNVYWRYAMLFDEASSKVCIVSCYDCGVDCYFDEIIKSIRFH